MLRLEDTRDKPVEFEFRQ